jgi:hypothetical protein
VAIYSTRFFHGPATNGQTLYTVPVGMVVVVRDLEVYNFSGAVINQVQVQLGISGTTSGVLAFVNNVPASECAQWSGRSVVNAGEELVAFSTTAGNFSMLVSGYLLV